MLAEWPQDQLDRFLRCPITKEGVSWADAMLLRRVNRAIEAGSVTNRVGAPVREPLDAALVDRSGTWIHPSWGGLPTLLPDDAIELSSVPEAPGFGASDRNEP